MLFPNSFSGIFDPDDIIDVIKQLYKTREGWLAPFPWCEDFQFRLGEIFIRLKVVRRKKTRGTVTEKGIKVSSLFDPHEECSKPRTVLIEGEPGVGKPPTANTLFTNGPQGSKSLKNSFQDIKLFYC